nr:hypothetical protein [Planctomycetota bacterium]
MTRPVRAEATALRWDHRSDQPHVITRRALRRRWRGRAASEYLGTLGWSLVAAPLAALQALAPPRIAPPAPREAIGLGISPLDHPLNDIANLLDEIGCQRVLVRFEWRRMHRWPELCAAIQHLNRPCLAVLVQDRPAVVNQRRWRAGLQRFHQLRPPQVEAVQAVQAINRLKWGCATPGEAWPLQRLAAAAQAHYAPNIPLLGSGVIDFEPLATLRSLIGNPGAVRFAAAAALLYVDRRGGPSNTQYGIFNLRRKIAALSALAAISPHCHDPALWLTEVN